MPVTNPHSKDHIMSEMLLDIPTDAAASPKTRLILAAEELFGIEGIKGVSLRQISASAGNGNVSAAQYHFKSKEGLLRAIMSYRRAQIDRYRRDYAAAQSLSLAELDAVDLLDIVNRGLFYQSNEKGQRSFARFLRAIILDDIFSGLWTQTAMEAPFTETLYEHLRQRMSHIADNVWEFRRRQLGLLVNNSIADYDQHRTNFDMPPEEFLRQLAHLGAAALAAPV